MNLAQPNGRRKSWFYLTGLLLVVLAAKLWLIGHFGNSTPLWDQWDAEASAVFVPYLEKQLEPAALFDAHGEHRIFFTRVLALGLFRLNGIWDPKMEMVVQALLHVGCITLLVGLCGSALRVESKRLMFGIFTALVFVMPFGFENTLWGFQSQFYFVTLWGLIGIACCWRYPTLSGGWWLGALALGLGLISMAGGVLAAMTAGALVLLRAMQNRGDLPRQAIGALVLGGLVGAGLLLIRHVPEHDPAKAHSLAQFIKALFHIASWPSNAWAPLIQCPPVFLLVWALWRRRPVADPAWLLIALCFWGWAQSAAIAYGRAGGLGASRYTDVYSITLCLDFACLLYLTDKLNARLKRNVIILCAVWISVIGGRLVYLAIRGLPPIIAARYEQSRIQEEHVRAFLASHDFAVLKDAPFAHIPYPDPARLAGLLDQRAIRDILPTNLRAALTPKAVTAVPVGSFHPDGYAPGTAGLPYEPVWGSYEPVTGANAKGTIEIQYPAEGRTSWLQLWFAGNLRAPGVSIAVIDERGRADTLNPTAASDAQWQSVRFFRPSGPFTLRVTDENPTAWLAFTLPREIGQLSIAADFLQSHAVLIAILGIALVGSAAWIVPARPQGGICMPQ